MELFAHNQAAYANALRMLDTRHKTCIIHPTGTGKAVIIAKCIADHPNQTHLVMAPGSHIFLEIKKHTNGQPFTSRTYHGLRTKKKARALKKFDYIYLDEFHRIGADKWGPLV